MCTAPGTVQWGGTHQVREGTREDAGTIQAKGWECCPAPAHHRLDTLPVPPAPTGSLCLLPVSFPQAGRAGWSGLSVGRTQSGPQCSQEAPDEPTGLGREKQVSGKWEVPAGFTVGAVPLPWSDPCCSLFPEQVGVVAPCLT